VGTKIVAEAQGCEMPPDVTPARNKVDAEVNMPSPSQSMRAIFVVKEVVSFLRFKENISPMMQMTQRGL